MKRKLVKQGAATMMISLPSKWIRQNNLQKGDEIELEEQNNNIILKSDKTIKENKAIIDISDFSILINRVLLSFYIKGIDELEIKFADKKNIQNFQKKVLNELLGFEIIKQTKNSILIKDITGTEKQNISDIIKRIFFILDSMAEELIISLEKNHNTNHVVEIDESVNKFVNFCLRILNKQGYTEFQKTPQIYSIISLLEEIGDLYKKIAQNKKTSKQQIEILNKLKSQLNIFKELFFQFNNKKALEFAENYEKTKSKIKLNNVIDFYLYNLNETIIKLNNYLLVASL